MTEKQAFDLGAVNPESRGVQRLYRMDPPLDGHEYVVVSAAVAMFSGPETYVFPANNKGDIEGWIEIEGSLRGTLDHELALKSAGYTVAQS